MRRTARRITTLLALAVTVLAVTLLSLHSAAAADPKEGSTGLGDELYPLLGNGGYDAQHYAIDLSVDMDAGTIAGTVTMKATATEDLNAFNLDFVGFDISKLTVNDKTAEFSRDAQNKHELKVRLATPVHKGDSFTTAVTYSGDPDAAMKDHLDVGWYHYPKGVIVASEPAGAAGWYPVNDHPLDKATYAFRITVAKPWVAAATGILKDTIDNGSTRTYVWDDPDLMASYLAAVDIGEFKEDRSQGPNGIVIRNYFPVTATPEQMAPFKRQSDMIEYFSKLYGPYPFKTYGVVMADAELGFAIETQTLSLFGRTPALRADQQAEYETIVAHELSHMWFGDSVSLKQWKDIWLNEGFATLSEFLWTEHVGGKKALDSKIQDAYAQVSTAAKRSGVLTGSPSANELFNSEAIYLRGGLTLHALRLRVGDDKFFKILQTYTQRYRYANANTADFIAVAEEVSGEKLQDFFDSWLYKAAVPPIPEMKLSAAGS